MAGEPHAHCATDVRHGTLYFVDGNITIRSAENGEGIATLFRVHKGILALNSAVFAGMFSLPDASADVQDTHDGTPLVKVTDGAADVAVLLTVLYDPGSLSLPRFDPDIPFKLTPIIALASKYQMDAVRKRAVEILEDNWSLTLNEWLRYKVEMKLLREVGSRDPEHLINGQLLDDCTPEPASAVRLAEDYNIPSILPHAYYRLAMTSASEDWDKYRADEDLRRKLLRGARTARWNLLRPRELMKVMLGKEQLIRQLHLLERAFTDYSAVCTRFAGRCSQVGQCVEKAEPMVVLWKNTVLNDLLVAAARHPSPLGILEKLIATKPLWGLCETCSMVLVRDMRRRQEEIWQSLPSMFSD